LDIDCNVKQERQQRLISGRISHDATMPWNRYQCAFRWYKLGSIICYTFFICLYLHEFSSVFNICQQIINRSRQTVLCSNAVYLILMLTFIPMIQRLLHELLHIRADNFQLNW
jgi:hypothetical protein